MKKEKKSKVKNIYCTVIYNIQITNTREVFPVLKCKPFQWFIVGVIISVGILSFSGPMQVLSGHPVDKQKVLFIIAFEGFKDEELEVPKQILEQAGATSVIASDQKGMAKGADGTQILVEISLDEINVDNYAAIVFVGGPGTPDHLWGNSDAINIAQNAYAKGKIIGAICLAPGVLAEAGILEGKRVTAFHTAKDKLEQAGATFVDQNVVIDGNIITANGPGAADKFAEAIGDQLFKVSTGETEVEEGQFILQFMVAVTLGLLLGIRPLKRKE